MCFCGDVSVDLLLYRSRAESPGIRRGEGTSIKTGFSEGSAVDAERKYLPINHDYYNRVWAQIRSSWVLPEDVDEKNEDLLTVVGTRIDRSGVIEEYWIERRSGHIDFGQSALRAAQKTSRMPPLPPEFEGDFLEVGIHFKTR